MKKYVVLIADGSLKPVHSKTESALLRYSRDHILGIIDPSNSGETADSILGFGGDIPVAGTLDELFHLNPNYLFLGTSNYGGTFLMEWYPMIIKAIQSKLNIINGLHQSLMDIAEFNLLAKKYRTKIVDLRRVEDKYFKFKGITRSIKSKKILVAGTNDLSGKLTTTIETLHALHKCGISADWLPTSLPGTQIKKKGVIVESLNSDHISGYIESELYELDDKFEYLLVEGRGSLKNQILSSAMMGIYHGTAPNGIILCHRVEESSNMTSVHHTLEFYRHLNVEEKVSPVIGISINSALFEEEKARELVLNLEDKFNLPVTDPIRFGIDKLITAIKEYF